jgi:prephenate dehydrogenase
VKLAVIGVGLIGGSFALALKQAGLAARVLGVARNPATRDAALALGIIDEACDLARAGSADVVLLAVPVGATYRVLSELAPHLAAHTVITDAGSTKRDVIAAARSALGCALPRFVPGHPIAGAEASGPQAARAELFQGRKVVLTPEPDTDGDALAAVRALWQAAGAQVENLTATEHDRVFAAVSHLPHLAAFALVDDLARREHADLLFRFAASGFRDFTRIAGSSPEMWRDIALANRTALLDELDLYIASLARLRDLLDARDGAALHEIFRQARDTREAWLKTLET